MAGGDLAPRATCALRARAAPRQPCAGPMDTTFVTPALFMCFLYIAICACAQKQLFCGLYVKTLVAPSRARLTADIRLT